MSDISKCKRTNFPIKAECYRYTVAAVFHQSYMETPGKFVNKEFRCSFFWLRNTYDRTHDLSQKYIKQFNEKAKD